MKSASAACFDRNITQTSNMVIPLFMGRLAHPPCKRNRSGSTCALLALSDASADDAFGFVEAPAGVGHDAKTRASLSKAARASAA
jgi:hypothetical protein